MENEIDVWIAIFAILTLFLLVFLSGSPDDILLTLARMFESFG
jgi:hypothetical protein